MIFTPDQIKRLPGSTVRLEDGRTGYIADLLTDNMCFAVLRMRDGRKALANTNSTAPTPIDIVEVLEWADEKQPEPTTTLEQLHDYHERIIKKLAQEISVKHVAKMKKAARLGVPG